MVGLHGIQLLVCGKVTCAYALHSGDICGQEVTQDTADLGTQWRWVVNLVIQLICFWNTRLSKAYILSGAGELWTSYSLYWLGNTVHK